MPTRAEPCRGCGGIITADPADPTPGVRAHQQTQRHRAWRGLRHHQCAGVGDSTCIVTIPLGRSLCHFCRRTLELVRRAVA